MGFAFRIITGIIKKNGNKEITIQHLINMMKMVDNKAEDLDFQEYDALDWEWE